MNTRDLQYFVALVKYKNYTRVAKKFKVSQPSITQAIQRLEREFNTQLIRKNHFHRDKMITRSGLLLYENAVLINDKIDLTRKEIDRANQKQIRFGLPPIIGKLYISKIVEEFSGDLLSRLQITSVGSHDLLNQLRRGEIDIAILGSTTPINEDDVFAELMTTRPFGVIVSDQNPLAKKNAVYFGELADQQFINYDQQYVHQSAFQAYCTYAQIKPQIVVYRLPNVSWIKELVRQGKGISLMVKDAVTNEPGIKALDILDPIPERFYISIVIRDGYVLSDAEEDFIKRMKQIHLAN
ncbi:LysR family transcriptional regulator [Limosilactobacillus fastidiosus]|uniref:LysR family transcriptional regulator n=1 Tax=Limosilactobacillus fastidiosus TaxID=2759855 RepID=A0A7W3YC44_9LACO|nr:LysR family transcriptional regulator [Limosilactobacillus fastidiosus]MBB1063381.1 LysR family transcriptional regulator [Limosilactobacillus fastidiosus]MBB1085938.1 LysR family transcriptional regulator [Limosilactobacillus fastidiosus]MCD7084649.1 LysR family transcriptional regulator [Limosilactobacillus fastidiosus]MCD7085725.1 LysR family transcriptional regulator [Limosilactobacillus fastidiosus]MCD7113802.1 LysR family transcriptional regulator [Limosilactobacillus fastidiosus]